MAVRQVGGADTAKNHVPAANALVENVIRALGSAPKVACRGIGRMTVPNHVPSIVPAGIFSPMAIVTRAQAYVRHAKRAGGGILLVPKRVPSIAQAAYAAWWMANALRVASQAGKVIFAIQHASPPRAVKCIAEMINALLKAYVG